MQTFLPYPSFRLSAAVLDQKRLGKQRVENLQIMKALAAPSENKGWANHPAVKMWRTYETSLLHYAYAVCVEWHIVRGFDDTCLRKTTEVFWDSPYLYNEDWVHPWWFGDKQFHLSHQSNLLRKDPEHYDKIFRGIPDNLEYVWPKSD